VKREEEVEEEEETDEEKKNIKKFSVTENNDETKLREIVIRSTADARAPTKSRCD
jgi:hypothetical protein